MAQSFLRQKKRRIALWSARIESYLTTRSFLLIFLLGYIALIGIFFFWGFYKQWKLVNNEPEALPCHADGTCDVMRYFISLARAGGFVLNITTALVIFLAAKTLFTLVRETPLQLILPLDNSFPFFHVVVGYTIVAAALIHGIFHLVWLIRWNGWSPGVFGFTMSAITGGLLSINFAVMLIFARKKERREHFRRFYIVHVLGAIIFFTLLFIHGMFYTEPETYKWILAPLIIYLIDRGTRYFRTKTSTTTITNENFVLKGNGIILLKFPKQFKYRAGQYADLMIPEINREWHPFTIASAPHEDEMHFFIKTVGDWTRQLEQLLQRRLENTDDNHKPLSARVMGPYGAPAQHVRSYHRVILVSGGVGSTPFSSISKHLHHLQVTKAKPVVEDSRTDTSALQNINHRLLQRLGDLYKIDLEDFCKTCPEEDILLEENHLINILDILGAKQAASTSADGSGTGDESDSSSNQKPNRDFETSAATQTDTDEIGDLSGESVSSNRLPASSYDDNEGNLMKHVGSVFYDIASSDVAESKTKLPHGTTGSVEKLREEQKRKHTFRGRLSSLYGKRASLLSFAHTTRVVFSMVLSLIIRGTLLCIGFILGSISLSEGVTFEEAEWIITVDTVLGIALAFLVTSIVLLEVGYMGKSYFKAVARVIDLFVLVPLVILSTAYGIRAWVGDHFVARWYIILHFFFILPALFTLLGYRLYRTVGSHVLLRNAPKAGKYKKIIPAVDFVWTTPRDDDDKWLREELNPLASGSELRLHRFVTRADENEVTQEEGYISSTQTGRPQWGELLKNITQETPSNKEVGVFFCGPKSMGSELQKALRKIEIISNLRGAYLHATPRTVVVSEMQLRSVRTIDLLKSVGCNIRFVYREENFGY